MTGLGAVLRPCPAQGGLPKHCRLPPSPPPTPPSRTDLWGPGGPWQVHGGQWQVSPEGVGGLSPCQAPHLSTHQCAGCVCGVQAKHELVSICLPPSQAGPVHRETLPLHLRLRWVSSSRHPACPRPFASPPPASPHQNRPPRPWKCRTGRTRQRGAFGPHPEPSA